MKITIEAETEEEEKDFQVKSVEYKDVVEFAVCGQSITGEIIKNSFSRFHVSNSDPFFLRGKLFELIERLREYGFRDRI